MEKVLGPAINEKQIFTEPTVMARLQSGELDAASAYKIQPGPFNLPYVTLPPEVNLSGQNIHADHPDMTLSVGGKTYNPEPLIYYAAVLKDAPNAKGAAAFVEWLKGDEGQAIFRRYNYDLPGEAVRAARMRIQHKWIARAGAALFALALLYPFTGCWPASAPGSGATIYAARHFLPFASRSCSPVAPC